MLIVKWTHIAQAPVVVKPSISPSVSPLTQVVTPIIRADIQIDSPQPNRQIYVGNETIPISGKAKGTWFFEGSFPIRLEDASGRVLATTKAHATGDWMTASFVPFTAQIVIPTSFSGTANIVLAKDNPSGLPQKDVSVHVAIEVVSSQY